MRVSNVTIRKRILTALLIALCLYVVLISRLGYIQLFQGDELLERAEDLWNRDIPFEAKRGRIMDRNGEVLAYNITSPSIIAIPAQVEDIEITAQKLASTLNMNVEKLRELLSKKALSVWIRPDGMKLTVEKAEQVRDLDLPGIMVTEDSKRYYPNGSLAAHVLGFAGIDNQGLTGLELVYDDLLKGKAGAVSFYANAKGGAMPGMPNRFKPPTDGLDLVTTIDVQIQAILERYMEQAMLTYDPESVIGIVVDPNTGEVLAMGGLPTYDPSRYQEYSADIYNHNLPIWKMFEPGSTFKIVTLAAALEEDLVHLHNQHFHDPGHAVVAGARLRCWKREGHGSQTFLEVVENSCNPGFVELGQRLGKERFFDYIRDFGFGSKTGIDLRGEATGILFKPEQIGPVELATTAFGQGVSVTPIQQVMAVSAAINGGILYTPYIGKQWLDPVTGEVIEEQQPIVKKEVISPETSKEVREALESVVAKGTGFRAYVEGFRVGGKTGTAQKVGPNGRYMANNFIVSFIGFAPADDPQLVVYIAVDNPKGVQFGGVVASPIVGKVLDESLRYLGVDERTDGVPLRERYGELRYVTVPEITGLTINEIRHAHYHLPLDVTGDGNVVVLQTPKAGTRVVEGSKIRVYLGDK